MTEDAPYTQESGPVLTEHEVNEILNRHAVRWSFSMYGPPGQEQLGTDWQMVASDVYALIRTIEALRHMAAIKKLRGAKFKTHQLRRIENRPGTVDDRMRWRARFYCRCGARGSWHRSPSGEPGRTRECFDMARKEYDLHLKEAEEAVASQSPGAPW